MYDAYVYDGKRMGERSRGPCSLHCCLTRVMSSDQGLQSIESSLRLATWSYGHDAKERMNVFSKVPRCSLRVYMFSGMNVFASMLSGMYNVLTGMMLQERALQETVVHGEGHIYGWPIAEPYRPSLPCGDGWRCLYLDPQV